MAIIVLGQGKFGVDKDFGELAQSASINKQSSEATAYNYAGDFVAAALYGPQDEVSCEILVTDEDMDTIKIGNKLGSTNYVLTQVNMRQNATDFQTYSVTAKLWGSLGYDQKQS